MPSPLRRWFVDHPESVGESYPEHFGNASRIGFTMLVGGLACFVHALVPGLLQKTGSNTIKRLHGWYSGSTPVWRW